MYNQETQTESESNFVQIMKLQGEDDSRIITWLEKKTDKYTFPDIRNEILKTMALQVLCKGLNQFLWVHSSHSWLMKLLTSQIKNNWLCAFDGLTKLYNLMRCLLVSII